VATEFKRLHQEHGPHSLAAIGSPRATNEANYLLQKIFRSQLGCNNLDYPGGQSQQATFTGLAKTLGTGAMTSSLSEIEKAKVIFALGNQIEENNPIVATALRRANRTHGNRLITLSSAEGELGRFAEPAFIIPREHQLDFLQGLTKLLLELKLYDRDFVAANTTGLETLEKSLAQVDYLETVARADILPSTFEEFVRTLATAPSVAFVYSDDLTADANGARKVETIANLAMLTGRLGQPQSGIYPLYRHINSQGALDMGMSPSCYPGHVSVSDLQSNDPFSNVWSGQLPDSPGLSYRETIQSAHQQKVKGLFLMGENPIATEPEREKIQEALKQVEFLVVQDMFLTQSGQLADVVLPSTGFTEQEGTLTNTERRIQKLRPALTSPDGPRPDWRILADLLNRLDPGTSYTDAQSVYQEIITVVPFYEKLTYERLDEGGLQWPYTENDSSGMLTLDNLKKPLEFATS
jgi:predicted molibdopterin-dependent oxidoreductase YjgC